MKNLLVRTLTALLAAALLISCILAGKHTFLIFFAVLAMLSLNEFYVLSSEREIKSYRLTGLLTGFLMYVSTALYQLGAVDVKFFFFLIIPIYAIFIAAIFRKHPQPFAGISFTLGGIIYTVLPTCLFISIAFTGRHHVYNYQPALGFLFLLWANDTGAFFSGRFFGRNRLLERVSPKKTWEGLLGGVSLALGTAFLVAHYYLRLNLAQWLGMASLIVLFGTLGDLVESLYKRELATKDSGSILPGHGGLLDRFDGMFLAAPFVFLYLLLIGL